MHSWSRESKIARDYLAGFPVLHAFPSHGTQLRGIVRSNIEAETPLRGYTLAGCGPGSGEYLVFPVINVIISLARGSPSSGEHLLACSSNRKCSTLKWRGVFSVPQIEMVRSVA
jgi:hypothetical protein